MSKLAAISAVINLLGYFFNRKEINEARLRAATDAAERYMMVNEKDSPYHNLTDRKRERYLVHFRKRFIAYND